MLLVVGTASGLVCGVLLIVYFFVRLQLSSAEPAPAGMLLRSLPHLAVRYVGVGMVIGAVVGLVAAAGRAIGLLLTPRRAAAIVGAVVPAFVVAVMGVYGFMHASGEFRLLTRPGVVEVLAGVVGALIVLITVLIVDRREGGRSPLPSGATAQAR